MLTEKGIGKQRDSDEVQLITFNFSTVVVRWYSCTHGGPSQQPPPPTSVEAPVEVGTGYAMPMAGPCDHVLTYSLAKWLRARPARYDCFATASTYINVYE